ncbi:uncharacterized protein UHOD_11979 [Ustilago sp. UG-2017b]|nr:uncharacterized protein UHOD_11834 [Ustilago sp. UG-2017b]SPC66152.1 uncharacterized protein UHOD_11979 [Ustilago sp. UG-2017b]
MMMDLIAPRCLDIAALVRGRLMIPPISIQVDADSDDPQHDEYQPNNRQSPQDAPPAEDMTVEGPTQGTAANALQKKRRKIKNDAKFRSSYSRKLIALKRPHRSDGTFEKESTFQCKS